MKQQICVGLNWMRIRQFLPQPYIPQTGMQVPWRVQWLGAGVYGLWRNPRASAAVECRETDWGDVREETVVGNAGGGKPWKQGDTAESCIVGRAITTASLSPDASISSWTVERLAHHVPDTLNYRTGPQPLGAGRGGPVCLVCWATEEGPRQGSPLSAWTGGATEKDRQRGLLIASYTKLEKRPW